MATAVSSSLWEVAVMVVVVAVAALIAAIVIAMVTETVSAIALGAGVNETLVEIGAGMLGRGKKPACMESV